MKLLEKIDKVFEGTGSMVDILLEALIKAEADHPDDKWDEQCLKGFKAGIIESISRIIGKELNYNLTATEIKELYASK